jgi:benzoate-CoA ligase
MSVTSQDLELPDPFNFAAHLIKLNHKLGEKPAFIDDTGTLTYAGLETQVQQFASGLLSLGLRPEERFLLLMLGPSAF